LISAPLFFAYLFHHLPVTPRPRFSLALHVFDVDTRFVFLLFDLVAMRIAQYYDPFKAFFSSSTSFLFFFFRSPHAVFLYIISMSPHT